MSATMLLPTPTRETRCRGRAAGEAGKGRETSVSERQWRGTLLWALVVTVAFGLGRALPSGGVSRRGKEPLPPKANVADRDQSAITVTVEPVTYRTVQRAVEGIGTLYGFEEISVSAQVEGRVRKLYFDVADRVKPGEVLLEIDPTDSELAVQEAERALKVELAKLGRAG